jgi:putative SOS response-associated peptidase YedK
MCTEFDQSRPAEEVAEFFGVIRHPAIPPQPNRFPRMPVSVVALRSDGGRGLVVLRWGLVPSYYNDSDQKPQPHNATAEKVDQLLTFRESFRIRRCLVPASAFYEWGTVAGKKRKHRFRFTDGRLFAFAGLWDCWQGDGGDALHSCCFITGKPNELVGKVHRRMPVILAPDDYGRWLDPDTPVGELKALLRPYPAHGMECLTL